MKVANAISSLNIDNKLCSFTLPYGVCEEAADTAAKTVTVPNFSLEAGATVIVKFTNANSVASPTLNVNSTGAKAIKRYGTTDVSTGTTTTGWVAGAVQMFTYDGTNWIRDYWNNTTYSNFVKSGSSAKAGLVPKPSTTAGTTKYLREDGKWQVPPDTNTVYTHPSYTARTGKPTANQTPAFGETVTVSQITSDATGHVTAATDRTITIPNTAASSSAAGLVTTGSQTLAGAKTFSGKITASSGITTGGDIVSDTANTDDVGSTSIPFANMYTKNLYVNPKSVSGSIKFYGSFAATTEGTTTTNGCTELKVGNNTPTGSDGNAQGFIQIYNASSGSATLETGHSNSSDYRIYLPSAGGTLALNSTFGKSGSTAKSGLVPAPSTTAGTTKYLREDGKWQVPPDNNTTYTFATGDSNGQIKVTPSGGSAQNISVKGLGSAAYTASTAYATAAQGTLATNAMPKSGGTFTGEVTHNAATKLNYSTYMKNGVGYNGYQTDGTAVVMTVIDSSNNLWLGSTNYPHSGSTIIKAPNGDVNIYANDGGRTASGIYLNVPNLKSSDNAGVSLTTTEVNDCNAFFKPNTTGNIGLGSSSLRWYKLYSSSTCSTSSDEREKSDIMSISDYPTTYSRDGSGNIFEKLFNKLVPKTYTLNIESSGELHMGFVAQDVINAMEELGLSENDLAIVDHDYWIDEETGKEKDRYGLSYEQFIALNTYMIQKQQTKIETLEERIAQLEELVNGN